jgi:hypothetical protein
MTDAGSPSDGERPVTWGGRVRLACGFADTVGTIGWFPSGREQMAGGQDE